MAKKTKAEEEYADLVIQSLVQEDYSVSKPTENAVVSNDSQDMKDNGDALKAHGMNVDEKFTNTEKDVATTTPQVPQSNKTKAKAVAANKEYIVKRDYEESFVRESGMTARKGKQVCIRSNFHDRIMKLIQVIGKNEVTIASYIDNVLASHFEDYQEDIAESFGKHIKTFTNI